MKKGKLFVLPFLAMAIGTLSSCTKDDIKALQDKDIDLQSQIDGLKEEVAGLKNQITDLKTELATKVQEVKDDYGAKIKAANDEITADKAALATLTSTYNTEKAALEAALRAEIKAVDDKYAPLVQALQADVAGLKAEDTRLAGLISDLESALGGDTSDLEAKINNVNTALEALKTALKDYDLSNPSVKGVADKVAAVDARVDALSSQAAADKAELSTDYNAKINALSSTVSANYSHFENEIDNLQDQIDDLNDELAAKVLELQNDYNAKINALTERVAALEDVPVYTVTFDPNYDFFNGDVAVNGRRRVNRIEVMRVLLAPYKTVPMRGTHRGNACVAVGRHPVHHAVVKVVFCIFLKPGLRRIDAHLVPLHPVKHLVGLGRVVYAPVHRLGGR